MAMSMSGYRKIAMLSAGFAFVLLSACSSGGDDGNAAAANEGDGGVASATSTLCSNVTGAEAIIWDIYNGVIRTDSVLPPPLPVGGGTFTHTATPLLGFFYPAGYNPTQIGVDLGTVGVDLIRDDLQVAWRQLQQTPVNNVTAGMLRDTEKDIWLTFFGLQGTATQALCDNEGSVDAGGGIIRSFANTMFRVGDFTFLIASSATALPGFPGQFSAFSKVVVAPTSEFPERSIDTFLAIDWQLLIGENSNLFDTDGDGVPDGIDAEPNNPNVS